jgi:RNA polymerase sigma-70 factor (ECF subfamily)
MSVFDVVPSPSRLVVAKDEVHVLLLALRRIPIDFQIVIELFYWERSSLAEIATVLEVAVGTVKSRLSRARDALKHAIDLLDVEPALRGSTSDRLEHWAQRLRAEIFGGDGGESTSS